MNMHFEDIPEYNRGEIQEILHAGDTEEMSCALLSAALYDDDAQWSERVCQEHLLYKSEAVQLAALTALSHIARIHRDLNLSSLSPLLTILEQNPILSGRVSDLRDDIRMFVTGSQ